VQEPPAAMVPADRFTDEAEVVIVPEPQAPVNPFGLATTSPAGNVSLKPTPVKATVALGLVMVKLSVVAAFRLMLAAPNALAIDGGAMTVRLAVLLGAPAPLSVEEIGPVVLFCTPAVTPVTFRLIEQEPLAGSVPADKLIELEPAAALAVPPQVLVSPFGVATTSPAGRASLNATPDRAIVVLGLLMLKVNDVFAFNKMLAAPKAFVMVGAVATLRFADAVFPVPPFVEVTFPVVFVYWPAATPVTVTLNWHWLLGEMVAPVSEIPVGAVVVSVPPQTVAEALATLKPVGNVSVKATPANATAFAAGLVIVNVSEVVAFKAIFAGLKTFAIVGGATTLIEAVAGPPVPPSFELTLLVVLFCVPAAIPVTFTEKVQDAFAARVPPARIIAFVPAVAVTVPAPQEPLKPFGLEMTRPAGSVSLNATPVSAVFVLLF
jgi:hypothetical protein